MSLTCIRDVSFIAFKRHCMDRYSVDGGYVAPIAQSM